MSRERVGLRMVRGRRATMALDAGLGPFRSPGARLLSVTVGLVGCAALLAGCVDSTTNGASGPATQPGTARSLERPAFPVPTDSNAEVNCVQVHGGTQLTASVRAGNDTYSTFVDFGAAGSAASLQDELTGRPVGSIDASGQEVRLDRTGRPVMIDVDPHAAADSPSTARWLASPTDFALIRVTGPTIAEHLISLVDDTSNTDAMGMARRCAASSTLTPIPVLGDNGGQVVRYTQGVEALTTVNSGSTTLLMRSTPSDPLTGDPTFTRDVGTVRYRSDGPNTVVWQTPTGSWVRATVADQPGNPGTQPRIAAAELVSLVEAAHLHDATPLEFFEKALEPQ